MQLAFPRQRSTQPKGVTDRCRVVYPSSPRHTEPHSPQIVTQLRGGAVSSLYSEEERSYPGAEEQRHRNQLDAAHIPVTQPA